MYICMFACVFVCVFTWLYIRVCTRVFPRACMCACVRVLKGADACAYVDARASMCGHFSRTRVCGCTWMCELCVT